MIFSALYEAARAGELLLVEGGMCRYHLRRDGQLVIREILSTRPGAGRAMLEALERCSRASAIVAKCPADLEAAAWWPRRGFVLTGEERTRSGRLLYVYRRELEP